MLTTKKGKNILRCRWGKKRSPSHIVRISAKSRIILDSLPDRFRRDFVDGAIFSASRLPSYARMCAGGEP